MPDPSAPSDNPAVPDPAGRAPAAVPANAPANVPATAPTNALAVPHTELDRAAVERVLARAAELQVASSGDSSGLLSEEQLLDLGREVGLAPEVLRQALAEERTRIVLPTESGWLARQFGPATASSSRTVRGTPAQALALLDAWMQRDECLQVKRRFPDRLTWEPRRDLLGSLRRGLNVGGRGYALTRAVEVAATAVPVDDQRVLVRLDADLRASRAARLRGGGATAATGVLGGGTLATLLALVAAPSALAVAAVAAAAVIPVAIGVGGGYVLARQHTSTATRVQLALEQLLDRLEHERGKPGVMPLLPKLW